MLGSYDPQTKKLMRDLQKSLTIGFAGEPLMVYLLEDVTSFSASDETGELELLVEFYEEKHATVYIFKEESLLEVCDLDYADIESDLGNLMLNAYNIQVGQRKALLSSVAFVSAISRGVVVLREMEVTRGGELVELCYLVFGKLSNLKLLFLKREGIALSGMVEEILNAYELPVGVYSSEDDMHELAISRVHEWISTR